MRFGPNSATPPDLALDDEDGVRLSDALTRLADSVAADRISLGMVAGLMGRRSISALLLILALPLALPVPAPGISVLFGMPLALLSAQLALGGRRPWLPAVLANRSLARPEFQTLVDRCVPALRRMERLVRPRYGALANDWAMLPVGVICFALAVIIVLSVPFGHLLPGTAICVLALGLLERDGLTIGVGLAVSLLALVVIAGAAIGLASWLNAV